ncbi:hypothetical protein GGF32_007494 [Allomyces javanicus]|nr:hypothetical protein GGF32_007494 [Allomyces javanicus]
MTTTGPASAAAGTALAAVHDTTAMVPATESSGPTDTHLAALAATLSVTASTPIAATTAAPAPIAHANRPRKFDDLPVDVLARILSRAVAGHEPDALQLLLSWRALNRTWKAVIEGKYFESYFETLLAQWNVKPSSRARTFLNPFSLVMRELQAGRSTTCRRRVEREITPFGGRCRPCRVRSLLESAQTLLESYQTDPAVFRAKPRRQIVEYNAPGENTPGVPRRIKEFDRSMLLDRLHLLARLVEALPYRAFRNEPMGIYKIRVVERVMAIWTGRTIPAIDISPDVPDWRQLDLREWAPQDGTDGTEDDDSDSNDYEDDEGEQEVAA